MSEFFWARCMLAAAGAATLIGSAWSIWQFEQTIGQGQSVLLELAPVDPRSLMQGDYMALRYALEEPLNQMLRKKGQEEQERVRKARYAYLAVDGQRRASFVDVGNHLPSEPQQVAVLIRYEAHNARPGPNAFFFQEGTAEQYQRARWGELRVAPDGKALLVTLRDQDLNPMGSNRF